jgi:CheY-like chemotaxis protein
VPGGSARARPPLDLPTYERFIDDGIADADARGTPVDHVTARRLAIWLAARPQPPVFARNLVHFVNTGAVSHALRTQLRIHARSGNYPDKPQSARLMEYCVARGTETGPIGEDFGATCNQIDRADVMLADLRDRTRHAARPSRQPQAGADGPEVIALARRDPQGHTISIVMDAATANIAMYAITAYARDREAHLREVEQYGQTLPEGSYGRANRQTIAAREARLAARLRAVEHAFHTAIDRDDALSATQRARALRVADHVPDWEMELD